VIVIVAIMVILETSIIASIVSPVVALVVTAIIPAVVMPVVMVVATVIVAIVAMIITSIPIIVAMIGHAITVIMSIRSTVMIVKELATVPVVVVVALILLEVRRYSKGMFQLLTLPHGALGIAVELALVVHDHVKVTFKEGGKSWWICYVGFTRSLV
jgi:hypothetical protein